MSRVSLSESSSSGFNRGVNSLLLALVAALVLWLAAGDYLGPAICVLLIYAVMIGLPIFLGALLVSLLYPRQTATLVLLEDEVRVDNPWEQHRLTAADVLWLNQKSGQENNPDAAAALYAWGAELQLRDGRVYYLAPLSAPVLRKLLTQRQCAVAFEQRSVMSSPPTAFLATVASSAAAFGA